MHDAIFDRGTVLPTIHVVVVSTDIQPFLPSKVSPVFVFGASC